MSSTSRRRRPVAVGDVRRLDRRNALFVLAANLPLLTMLWMVGGCVAGSLARAFYFLLTKQLDQSAAYAYSVASLLGHPVRLARARRRRARGHAAGYNAVRVFIPPARTLFRVAEQIAGLISTARRRRPAAATRPSADESEEDEQFIDTQSVLRRLVGHPGVQLFAALLVIALIAERRLLGASPLGGGALVPAWGGAPALWQEYLAGFHAVSVGSTASAPPYLAVVAALGHRARRPGLAGGRRAAARLRAAGRPDRLPGHPLAGHRRPGPGAAGRVLRAAAGGHRRAWRRAGWAPRSPSSCFRLSRSARAGCSPRRRARRAARPGRPAC